MIPKAFVAYLYHFHVDRDYFECHEVLEEYWKNETSQQKDSIWVGFILLAVANYHHRRLNFAGAYRTLTKAVNIMNNQKKEISNLGLDGNEFFNILDHHVNKLQANEPYKSYSIPIINPVLLRECKTLNEGAKVNWGKESDLSKLNLIHCHKLRDRSDVIANRQYSLNKRHRKDSE